MPITKRNGKYYWGSKGPFDSHKKAEEVAQAAHASGYEEKNIDINDPRTVGSARDEGERAPSAAELERHRRRTLQKEGDGDGGTVFTSGNAGIFTPTYGGSGVHHQQRKKKKRTGVEKAAAFMDDRSPHVFTKSVNDLNNFIENSAFPSDNFESQNRMNNPKRLNWEKKKTQGDNYKADDTQHAVEYSELPEGQFHKSVRVSIDQPQDGYVERGKNKSMDREKWADYTLAHQDDMEKKIRGYDKESKKKHDDPHEPPAHEVGSAVSGARDMFKQEGYGFAGQDDELRRGGDKDKIARRRSTKTPEEIAEYVRSSAYMKQVTQFTTILKSLPDEDNELS